MTLATQYHAALLSKSPTMLWKCDDASGLLQDSSGNGKHADTSASLLYGQTDFWGGTGAVGADAVGDWAQRSSAVGFTQTDDFTATWIYKTHPFANAGWVQAQFGVGALNTSPFDGWWYRSLDWNTVGQRRFTGQTAGGGTPATSDAADLLQNTWYHIVVRRAASGGEWRSWINGVLQAETGESSAVVAPTKGPFIFNDPSLNAVGQSNGFMHSVAWIPTALSDTECAGLYTDATVLQEVTVTVYNGSSSQLVNVNAAGVDIDARSHKVVLMTWVETAALLLIPGVQVFSEATTLTQARARKSDTASRFVST